ncbi:MAG: molybdopterin-binding/glycosyltransferase family 2 protein [Ferrovibrio sp.]|nr:molybdopterin-binding/glycosyltransferase family 2 protein [Ferrovibrio sp.]
MFFGPVPVREAEGCILGHSMSVGTQRFRKGRVLSAEDVQALRQAGQDSVYAARLGPDDVPEDQAASRIAEAAAGTSTRAATAFTGRANIYAEAAGIAVLEPTRVDALNLLHEAVTIATVAPYDVVEPGQMLATVKIIPFAAPRDVVQRAAEIAAENGPLVRVAPFAPRRVGLVMTRVDDTKDSVLAKTEAALRERLLRLGSDLGGSLTCEHDATAIAVCVAQLREQGCAPILVFGGSAIVDREDVVPAGIVAAGGIVEHFGMPVDPGNLLLIGRLAEVPVVGVPGCARSPKLNGFDWVLQRLCAGLGVGRAEIMRMGAGGLLKEIPTRPQPRSGPGAGTKSEIQAPTVQRRPRIAAVILAGGLSSRMQGGNKLLADLEGKPILRHVVEHVLASPARPVIIVTGHRAEEVQAAALAGAPSDGPGPDSLSFTHNPDFAGGLATSLVAGIRALPEGLDGALICLGDMPDVPPRVLDKLISAFNPVEGRAICVPVVGSKRGNPILWGAQFFNQLKGLDGDSGARRLLEQHSDWVCEVAAGDDGVLNDIDTAEALAARRLR